MCAPLLSHVQLFCDLPDCSPRGSSVHGTLQARILEWVAISSSRGSSRPRDQTHISWVSCTGRQILYLLSHLGSPLNTTQPAKPGLSLSSSRQPSLIVKSPWPLPPLHSRLPRPQTLMPSCVSSLVCRGTPDTFGCVISWVTRSRWSKFSEPQFLRL